MRGSRGRAAGIASSAPLATASSIVRLGIIGIAVGGLAIGGLAIGGCGGDEPEVAGAAQQSAGPSTTTGGQGAAGGSIGQGAAGGGGAAGAGGASDGGAGIGGLGPQEPCEIDVAFGGTDIAFTAPTPLDMVLAFTELTYDNPTDDLPLLVLLTASFGLASAEMTVSGSEYDDTLFEYGFPATKVPVFVPADVGYGEFSNSLPQSLGYLHLTDDDGTTVDIELNNLIVKVKTDDCLTITATLDAIIPASQAEIELSVGGDTTTIGQLGGDTGNAVSLRALFQGESVDFDYGTL